MKNLFLTLSLLIFALNGFSQKTTIYDVQADAAKEIKKGLLKAKTEKKNLFIQIGGNWCPWCIKFHEVYLKDPEISKIMDKSFVKVLVNYSKENKNLAVLKSLEFPQRFGFPVFVILDAGGKRIHTQNSAYLEEGSGYSKKKVIDFLNQWSPDALNPKNYK
jgi:thioredoxin-related protein